MKQNIKIYLLAVVAFLASSCRTLKSPTRTRESKTFVKETIRDTVVAIPAGRSSFRAEMSVDNAGNAIIKNVLSTHVGKRAKAPQVQIKDQVLKVDCLCDSMSIYLKLKDTHITDMLKETVFVPTEKPLSAWQQVQLWLGRVLLIAITGGLIMLILIKKIV
jgi:hypothetical protein